MSFAAKRVGAVAFALTLMPSLVAGQDAASDEQRITELEQQWVDAIEARDVDAVVEFYAEDGRVMPPNAEPAIGRDSVRGVWSAILELPGLDMSFEPAIVKVAESGDIAYTIGNYQMHYDGDQGRVLDSGKYIDLWEKVDGEWKVRADMFSSNLPPI